MRKSWVQLYAPFIALALVQALFIAVAPSRGPAGQQLGTVAAGPVNGELGAGPGGTGSAGGTDGATDSTLAFDGGGTGPTTGVTAGGGRGGGPLRTGGGGPGGGGNTGELQAAGDTSHCTPDGKQFGIIRGGGPPCKPKFVGDNGGSTYQGVTAKEIKIVFFASKPNEQVNAILATQGLATSTEEQTAAINAYVGFVNKRYELYGRKIVWKRIEGDCPTTPPDYDACIAAAQQVVKEKPFMVVWGTPLYASVFDVWAKNGIIAVGGWHFDDRFFTQRRPYRWDVFMDGTQSADIIAEYFCKKLANKKATHAGALIHPTIGARGQVDRHLGIVVPEIEANVLTAQRVQAKVQACNGGRKPPIFTYESDIERATEQTQATVSGLINAKVTTVVCMCDPIAPAFLTKGETANNYFPEFLMPGLGLLDYDKLGRLYDPQQMAHAFGPSHLGLNIPLDDTDQARVWRDMGNSGHPCGDNGCGVEWAYVSFVGSAIHLAGPNLNPATFEQGLFSAPPRGGTPDQPLADFGPGDYTALGDAKEVFWSNTSRSSIDGQPGAFVPLDGGRRYKRGQWTSEFKIPVPAS